jgi:hypothetical protein
MRARKPEPPSQDDDAVVQIATVVALSAVPMLTQAAEPEVLDEAFLDYLAEFDEEEDDWSWFDAEDKASDAKKAATDNEPKPSTTKPPKEQP